VTLSHGRRLLAACACVLLLAACGSGGGAGRAGLPAQGLVVAMPHALLLVGLDGRVLRTLPGFKLAPETGEQLLDQMVQRAMGATYGDDPEPVMIGPRGRVWQLAGGRLAPLRLGVLPLPGGAEIDGRLAGRRSDRSPIFAIVVRDSKTHRLLAGAGFPSWFVTAGRLLVTPRVVTDLVTRERWRLRSGTLWGQGVGTSECNPAGIANDEIVAVCSWVGPTFAKGYDSVVRAYAVRHDGTRELLGAPFLYANFGAQTALLSPDGKFFAATLAVGCGLSPSVIGPTTGGTPRYVDGSSDVHVGRHAQGVVLGWDGGRAVVELAHGECEKASPPGVYLVDPSSFRRSRIYALPRGATGFDLWSSAG
jgi:hypothetical protein